MSLFRVVLRLIRRVFRDRVGLAAENLDAARWSFYLGNPPDQYSATVLAGI